MNYEIIVLLLMIFISWFYLKEILNFNWIKRINNVFILLYIIFLIIVLFNRKTLDNNIISNTNYLKEWLPKLFTNKIVFINFFGNIVLFMPLGMIFKRISLNKIMKIIILLIIICSIEVIQYISKKGIFDMIDIFLNIIGTILGYIFIQKRGEKYE